jgi:hypothetical protein
MNQSATASPTIDLRFTQLALIAPTPCSKLVGETTLD